MTLAYLEGLHGALELKVLLLDLLKESVVDQVVVLELQRKRCQHQNT